MESERALAARVPLWALYPSLARILAKFEYMLDFRRNILIYLVSLNWEARSVVRSSHHTAEPPSVGAVLKVENSCILTGRVAQVGAIMR